MKKLLIAIGFVLAASAARANTYIPVLMSTATNPAVQAGSSTYSFHVASGTADNLTASTFTATRATITSAIASTITVNGNTIQATAGTRTYTIPDAGANASIMESTGAQTMSNKTLDNATLSTNMAAGGKVLTGLGAGAAAGQSVRFEQNKVIQQVFFNIATASATSANLSAPGVPSNIASTITPTSSSNKVLVQCSVPLRITGTSLSSSSNLYLKRGSTEVTGSNISFGDVLPQVSGVNEDTTITFTWLDSPATTSATTYTVWFTNGSASNTTTLMITNNFAEATMLLTEMAP